MDKFDIQVNKKFGFNKTLPLDKVAFQVNKEFIKILPLNKFDFQLNKKF